MKDSDSVMDLDTDSNRSASGTNDGRLTERPDKEASINEETEEVKESQTARKDNKEQPNNSVDSDEYKAATQNKKGPPGQNGATEIHNKRTSNTDSDSKDSDSKDSDTSRGPTLEARTQAGEETEEREAAKAQKGIKNMMSERHRTIPMQNMQKGNAAEKGH